MWWQWCHAPTVLAYLVALMGININRCCKPTSAEAFFSRNSLSGCLRVGGARRSSRGSNIIIKPLFIAAS